MTGIPTTGVGTGVEVNSPQVPTPLQPKPQHNWPEIAGGFASGATTVALTNEGRKLLRNMAKNEVDAEMGLLDSSIKARGHYERGESTREIADRWQTNLGNDPSFNDGGPMTVVPKPPLFGTFGQKMRQSAVKAQRMVGLKPKHEPNPNTGHGSGNGTASLSMSYFSKLNNLKLKDEYVMSSNQNSAFSAETAELTESIHTNSAFSADTKNEYVMSLNHDGAFSAETAELTESTHTMGNSSNQMCVIAEATTPVSHPLPASRGMNPFLTVSVFALGFGGYVLVSRALRSYIKNRSGVKKSDTLQDILQLQTKLLENQKRLFETQDKILEALSKNNLL